MKINKESTVSRDKIFNNMTLKGWSKKVLIPFNHNGEIPKASYHAIKVWEMKILIPFHKKINNTEIKERKIKDREEMNWSEKR